jgi:type IV pilus assembly protein PilO
MKAFGIELSMPAESLAKLTRNQKTLILGGTVLALVAVFTLVSFMPHQKKARELTAKVESSNQELAQLRETVARMNRFKQKMVTTEIEFKKALAMLPNKKEIPGLLSSVSQLGSQSGLEFLLFKPQPEIPKQFYADIPVEIKVLGPYHNVAAFFDRVSKLPRIVNISQMKMGGPKEASTGEMLVTTECLATTYKFLETPAEGAPGKDAKGKGKAPIAK